MVSLARHLETPRSVRIIFLNVDNYFFLTFLLNETIILQQDPFFDGSVNMDDAEYLQPVLLSQENDNFQKLDTAPFAFAPLIFGVSSLFLEHVSLRFLDSTFVRFSWRWKSLGSSSYPYGPPRKTNATHISYFCTSTAPSGWSSWWPIAYWRWNTTIYEFWAI